MKLTSLYIALLLIIFVQPSFACLCGSHSSFNQVGAFSGSIITIPATTLKQGDFSLGFGTSFVNYGEFSQNKLRSLNKKSLHTHGLDSSLFLNANLSYGLTENLSLTAIMPYSLSFDLVTTDLGNTISDGDSIGFGDLSILSKYKFYESRRSDLLIAALMGIKIPTGNNNQRNEFGFLLGSDDQPGSGSWDPIMGLALSKELGRYILDTNFLYILSTKGKQDTIVGDRVFFNLSASRALNFISSSNYKWSFSSEINGLWNEKVESNGIKDGNHGGLVIFLSPGLKLNIHDRIFSNFFISFPVIQDLNGEQSDINLQLGFNINFLI